MTTAGLVVTERPILFSGSMVSAILEGRKTQTRRVVKLSYPSPLATIRPIEEEFLLERWPRCDREMQNFGRCERIHCPYGVPGNRLWVRETWEQVHPVQVGEVRFSLKGRAGIPGPPPVEYRVIYRADGEYPRVHFQTDAPTYPYRTVCSGGDCVKQHLHPEEGWHGWIPSIFMPRWASRITLEITKARVERLQKISEEDAVAEGCRAGRVTGKDVADFLISDASPIEKELAKALGPGEFTARHDYTRLWDSINGTKHPWNSNPLVWVLEFKRVEQAHV
jgi:hypothetical protein